MLFKNSFIVHAPRAVVARFHDSTKALKRLTPPPVFVQLQHIEPLGEGSKSDFTMWFGPLPIRWTAIHSEVKPLEGFTDTQIHGPLKYWKHIHRFEKIDRNKTRVTDEVEYEHFNGRRGITTRILFSPLMLRLIFAYRGWVTRTVCIE
jgi:ligand-binding SRPBCC domain-containing protein